MYFERTSDKYYALQDIEKEDAELLEMAMVFIKSNMLTDPELHRDDRRRAAGMFNAVNSVLDTEKKETLKSIKEPSK